MEKSQTQFLTGVLEQIRALKRQAEELESQVAAYLEDMDMAENAGTDVLFAAAADEDLPEAVEDGHIPEDVLDTEAAGDSDAVAEAGEDLPEAAADAIENDDLPEMPEMEMPAEQEEPVTQAETAGPAGEAPVFDIELDDDIEIVPIGEAHAATGAVMDKMAEKESWRTDMPGSGVSDIRSAISLNDRILFINTLFHEDPIAFKEALSELNTMPSFEDGVKFILKLHPEWNTESEVVYRFMMAVRRKLK